MTPPTIAVLWAQSATEQPCSTPNGSLTAPARPALALVAFHTLRLRKCQFRKMEKAAN
jgi:hypothetical protein